MLLKFKNNSNINHFENFEILAQKCLENIISKENYAPLKLSDR
jgi:hypothetical protein